MNNHFKRAIGLTDPIIQLVLQFNAALNEQDVDAMMRLMTQDCVFENTAPPPDGSRYAGQSAVHAFCETFFRTSREPSIEVEEIFALGERCIMRWTYRWVDAQGKPGIGRLGGDGLVLFIPGKLLHNKGK